MATKEFRPLMGPRLGPIVYGCGAAIISMAVLDYFRPWNYYLLWAMIAVLIPFTVWVGLWGLKSRKVTLVNGDCHVYLRLDGRGRASRHLDVVGRIDDKAQRRASVNAALQEAKTVMASGGVPPSVKTVQLCGFHLFKRSDEEIIPDGWRAIGSRQDVWVGFEAQVLVMFWRFTPWLAKGLLRHVRNMDYATEALSNWVVTRKGQRGLYRVPSLLITRAPK
jgi:hypothetical protein